MILRWLLVTYHVLVKFLKQKTIETAKSPFSNRAQTI